MLRYIQARNSCPNCEHTWFDRIPDNVMNLKKVDFVWLNRNQECFEWFFNLLSELELTQAKLGDRGEDRFLDIHTYITSALDRCDMRAVGLQLALDLMYEKGERDLITGLKTRCRAGRPDWKSLFRDIKDQNKGRVTVFFCGQPALGRVIQNHCVAFGFGFKKENF